MNPWLERDALDRLVSRTCTGCPTKPLVGTHNAREVNFEASDVTPGPGAGRKTGPLGPTDEERACHNGDGSDRLVSPGVIRRWDGDLTVTVGAGCVGLSAENLLRRGAARAAVRRPRPVRRWTPALPGCAEASPPLCAVSLRRGTRSQSAPRAGQMGRCAGASQSRCPCAPYGRVMGARNESPRIMMGAFDDTSWAEICELLWMVFSSCPSRGRDACGGGDGGGGGGGGDGGGRRDCDAAWRYDIVVRMQNL